MEKTKQILLRICAKQSFRPSFAVALFPTNSPNCGAAVFIPSGTRRPFLTTLLKSQSRLPTQTTLKTNPTTPPHRALTHQIPYKDASIFSIMTEKRGFSSSGDVPLTASELRFRPKIGTPGVLPQLEQLKFGYFFTDHMIEVDWTDSIGWDVPTLKPYNPIQIDPASSGLHYGLQAFEGIKAFKDAHGNIRIFRVDMHTNRFRRSAERLCLPTFDPKEMQKLITELLKIDGHFIPTKEGYSCYIRPVLFSTTPTLGVGRPLAAKLLIMLNPVGPYFSSGYKSIQILAESHYSRAFPGGTGDIKAGGNYAPTILPQVKAALDGFSQVLWLYKSPDTENDFHIIEIGCTNVFILLRNENGEKELVTPPLGDNLVLPGVTRDSILALAIEMGEYKVSERHMLLKGEFLKALKEKRVLEAFGSGTACVVVSIDKIHFDGVDYEIPVNPDDPDCQLGPDAQNLRDRIVAIQYGKVQHPWSYKI